MKSWDELGATSESLDIFLLFPLSLDIILSINKAGDWESICFWKLLHFLIFAELITICRIWLGHHCECPRTQWSECVNTYLHCLLESYLCENLSYNLAGTGMTVLWAMTDGDGGSRLFRGFQLVRDHWHNIQRLILLAANSKQATL